MDRVFYRDYVKSKSESYDFKDAFIKNITRKKVKRALSNINALKDKFDVYGYGLLNDVLFYLFLAISNCDFTDIQKERLDMWLDGYTEQDIANKYGVSRWVVSKSINASCDKIIKFLKEEVEW